MNFKNISIGKIIQQRVKELELDSIRICNFFATSEEEIMAMYDKTSLEAEYILKWSKLLEYDFFRIYSQHLILYAPQLFTNNMHSNNSQKEMTVLPVFRKNLYTKELIGFILELIATGKKTKQQVINEYRIPKTTLYKWIEKYNEQYKI